MKTLVIGDIHGYYRELNDALHNADYQEGDRLIFLGDYVDRGPQSREVMEFLTSLKGGNIFLRGNHEEYLIRALAGDIHAYGILMDNGFISTLKSYGADPGTLSYSQTGRHYILREGKHILLGNRELPLFLKSVIPAEHLAFIAATRYSFETDRFFFSHAGAEPSIPLHEQRTTDFVWGTDGFFLKQKYTYGKTLVFGHFHLMEPFLARGRIGLGADMCVRILITDYSPMVIVDSDGDYLEVRDEWLI
ncbi:MAG: Bis(5'-nucleosyl)-tetraphosphatase, symmetrical [Syntrophorhabdus sp. PtaB.Bin047]|jgi:serine/threonine protein phosphatase 1|nr:MAG: Bis(5'-nucleosyl)-tetraphosphatase, symmetrical [Syntrophorhabdus sp. PtaB.Bin047]